MANQIEVLENMNRKGYELYLSSIGNQASTNNYSFFRKEIEQKGRLTPYLGRHQ